MLGFGVRQFNFEKYSSSDNNSQAAAQKLEMRYVEGFLANGFRVAAIVSFAASTFPANSKIFFGFDYEKICEQNIIFETGFINLPGVKLLTRFASTLFLTVAVMLWSKKTPAIVIYSLHQPYVLTARICKFLFGCKVFVIVPDLPLMMNSGNSKKRFIGFLKRLDSSLLTKFASSFDGAAFICNSMRQALPFLAKNSVVIDGVVNFKKAAATLNMGFGRKKVIFYAGHLVESYGLKVLCASATLLPNDFEVWIAGAGDMRAEIELLANESNSLNYLGMLRSDEVEAIYSKVDLLINPRLMESEFVKFSFPSKLLEYLASGIPVLTSRLPTIEKDLERYFTFLDELTPEGVCNSIVSVFSDGVYDRLLDAANEAREYVINTRSAEIQIKKFISIMDIK